MRGRFPGRYFHILSGDGDDGDDDISGDSTPPCGKSSNFGFRILSSHGTFYHKLGEHNRRTTSNGLNSMSRSRILGCLLFEEDMPRA